MRAELAATWPAAEQRRQDPLLAEALSWPALLPKLPLPFPIPADTPPSPKRRYRSHYAYLGYAELDDPAAWARLCPFDLALRLIDFAGLEATFAAVVYAPSAKGHTPFHPVSLFLLLAWRLLNGWGRSEVLRRLIDPRNDDYRRRFGFAPRVYPTEGGLRHFETRLGARSANALIAQTVGLAQAGGCICREAIEHAILGVDGMLHDAASHPRCRCVDAACYRPAPRACAAKAKGQKGCDCQEAACRQVCKHATPRDPEARLVIYAGHNRGDSPNAPVGKVASGKPPRGKPRYGYSSLCLRLIDPVRRTSWVLGDEVLAANAPEDKAASGLMVETVVGYGWVHWEFAVADAGEGREPFLSTAYRLGLRRVVGLRAAEGDGKEQLWAIRGYDDKGIPVCPHGYRLSPNGWDEKRRRHKWCCRRVCEQQTTPTAPECPHRFDADKHGLVKDVGRTFADGSSRLVRDVPYGGALWKQLYGRARNAAEERNAKLEDWGLKRMGMYGRQRVRALVTVADMWVNLLTVVRLVREAVLAAGGPSPP